MFSTPIQNSTQQQEHAALPPSGNSAIISFPPQQSAVAPIKKNVPPPSPSFNDLVLYIKQDFRQYSKEWVFVIAVLFVIFSYQSLTKD